MVLLKGHCGVHATLTMHMSARLHSPWFEGFSDLVVLNDRPVIFLAFLGLAQRRGKGGGGTPHDYHFMAKHSLSMVLLFILAISAIRQQLRWRDYPTPISTQHALEAPKM